MKKLLFLLAVIIWKGITIHGIPSSYAKFLMSYHELGAKLLLLFFFVLLFYRYLLDRLKELKVLSLIKIGLLAPTAIILSTVIFNLIAFPGERSMIFHYPPSQRSLPFLLGALVVGPLFEEMFYRYTLIYTGRKKWLRILTTLCSLLWFSMAHIVNANGKIFLLIPYFIIGFWLTIVYLRNKNLWESVFAHIAYNSLVVLLAIIR
ncbi:type II CAAX endopeptidase family protein [Enterococcus sp.]|uniref:CPBP family intramembrane glutamic endopeptidase n=1 Tax=Enterococcus sp. TaxID=35783 RepID=UPI0025C327D7|nr:type II CAAX endopeptidase family protein [Enterococcus sp.]